MIIRYVKFNVDQITKALNSSTEDITSLLGSNQPKYQYNFYENFISGIALSWSAFFIAIMILASINLKKPYRERSYRNIVVSYPLMIIFFLIGQRGILAGNFSSINIGFLGSLANIALGGYIFYRTYNPVMKKWSREYLPPPPDLDDI